MHSFPKSSEFEISYKSKLCNINFVTNLRDLADNTWPTMNNCLAGRAVADFSVIPRFAVVTHCSILDEQRDPSAADAYMYSEKYIGFITDVLREISRETIEMRK